MATEQGHHANKVYIDQNGDLHLNGAQFFNDAEEDIAPALESLDQISIGELEYLDGVTAGTVTASKALVVDANKDLSTLRDIVLRNLDAGSSGTAGSVDVFPSTAAKGKLAFAAADSAGATHQRWSSGGR